MADVHTRELWKEGHRIKLIGQPFEILAVLLSKPGKLVTREELRSRLWPADTFVDFNHGLNAAMNKLREALCDSAENRRYIETLPRRGYRFIADVERARPREDIRPEGAIADPVPVEGLSAIQSQSREIEPEEQGSILNADRTIAAEQTRALRNRSVWFPILTSLLLIALLFGFLTWFYFSHTPRQTRVGRRPLVPRTPLTDLADPTTDPAFSPDGSRVAFRRQGYATGTSGIFVKTIGSPQLLQLTNNPADCCPAWSPNGRTIAFSRFSDKEHQIYAVAANGGGLHKLYATSFGPKHGELDFSADGNSIAFVGESAQGTSSIFMLSKDLTAQRIATHLGVSALEDLARAACVLGFAVVCAVTCLSRCTAGSNRVAPAKPST